MDEINYEQENNNTLQSWTWNLLIGKTGAVEQSIFAPFLIGTPKGIHHQDKRIPIKKIGKQDGCYKATVLPINNFKVLLFYQLIN